MICSIYGWRCQVWSVQCMSGGVSMVSSVYEWRSQYGEFSVWVKGRYFEFSVWVEVLGMVSSVVELWCHVWSVQCIGGSVTYGEFSVWMDASGMVSSVYWRRY